MPARLITEVIADISKLEADLKRAEARWRKYEETAKKAASLTLTGGTLGSAGGGGGAASAAQQQRSELRRQEEDQKAANRQSLEAVKAFQRARVEAVKAAFREEADLRRQDAADARRVAREVNQALTREQREAARAAREVFREDVRGQRGSESFQAVRDRETREDIRAFKQRADARAQLADFEREAALAADRAEAEVVADQIAREKQLEAVRLHTQRSIREAERQTEKERREAVAQQVRDDRELARSAAEARRAEAGTLRGQIRGLVGTGAGAGPPFRPIPTGSRPEDIRALRQHLDEANSAGARLSRTLRRVGEEDLQKAGQAARFFAHGLEIAAVFAAGSAFKQLVQRGIELNREWERFRFGLGTALALTSKVVDAQGKTVTGARAFTVFSRDSEKLFKGIREEANKTILTTEELVEVVSTNFSQAIRAGIPEKEIVGLTSRIAQVAKSLGLQGGTPQLVQEVRAILSGDIRRGATVAQVLGLTTEQVKNAREAGNLVKLLNERLAGAKPIIDAFGKSSEAAFTTLASKGQDFLRLSLEDVFKRITGRVLDFNKELSSENVEKFARRTGKVLSDLFKPIEQFLDSGRGEKLGESFAKAFQAIGTVANSAVFDDFLKLLNFIVDNHVAILEVLAGFQLLKGANAGLAGLAALGAPGGVLAGTTLGSRLRSGVIGGFRNTAVSAAEGAGGGAAVAAGARGLTGLRGAGATFGALGLRGTLASGASVVGGALLRSLPPAAIGAAIAGGLLAPFGVAQGADLAAEEQRIRFGRLPGQRAGLARAQDLLAQVEQRAVAARAAGQVVTPQTRFEVTPSGETLPIQLTLDQARHRVQIARDTEEQLRRVAKEGGDHRVQIEQEHLFQILDLERLGSRQRIAQLQGNVREQIAADTALAVARLLVDEKGNKRFVKNEADRQEEIRAIRADADRKLRKLDLDGFLEVEKARAAASRNQLRQIRVDLTEETAAIREKVRTRTLTEAQGEQEIAAKRKEAADQSRRLFEQTRDQAADLQADFTKATLRAFREQRQAREQLVEFERQTARQARDFAKQRIDAERGVTDAIRQQTELREDLALRRQNFLLRRQELPQRRRVEGLLREAGVFNLHSSRGGDVGVDEAIRDVAEQVLSGRSQNRGELGSQVLQGLQEHGVEFGRLGLGQFRNLVNDLFTEQLAARRRRLASAGLEDEQTLLGQGREATELGLGTGLSALEQNELAGLKLQQAVRGGEFNPRLAELERRRVGGAGGTLLEASERQVRESRESLAKLDEQENDLRRESVKTYRELQERIKETTVSLSDDFINLGKRARELALELPQFNGAINPAAVNAIAGVTPAGAAARAAALGPQQVNLTVDLRGGLTEGTVTDPIVQHLLDLVLTKLQQDLRRGPTGR